MILTVTLNGAIDRVAQVERLVLGSILRPTDVSVLPGGKGINVARAARLLGAAVMTTGFAGGHGGRWMAESLDTEGLGPAFVDPGVEPRTTYVIVDPSGSSCSVYEPGVPVPPASADELLGRLRDDLVGRARFVVIAGSVPPGLTDGFVAEMVHLCRMAGVRCLIDVSGEALRRVLDVGVDIVKINEEEARDSGLVADGNGPVGLAAALHAAGAALAVVTGGSEGAAAVDSDGAWIARPPDVAAMSTVGSGDAFTAGLVVDLVRGAGMADALRSAVAAGAANTLTLGAGQFDPADYGRLREQVIVSPVGDRRLMTHEDA